MTTGRRLRTVGVVTGSRAEYGLLRPVMRAIADRGLALRVIVAGMHLAPEFGDTVREIEGDGWSIDARVPMTDGRDTPVATARGIGVGITAMSDEFERLGLDAVLVLGDRVEAFAAAVAAAASNRVVAHVHGGDVTRGGFDESMRHAITKLAHIHFAATAASRDRILRLGERADRVFVVGAPGLDSVRTLPTMSVAELAQAVGGRLETPYLVLLQHPVSTTPDSAATEMEDSLAALQGIGCRTVCIYPNSDAGGRRMIEVIERRRGEPWLAIVANLEHDVYLNLLRHASALVGNSSSGIIEAASFGLPVVNIGPRQQGRERGGNVVDSPASRVAIAGAVQRVLSPDFARVAKAVTNPYGDGRASERIAETLSTTSATADLLQKQLAY